MYKDDNSFDISCSEFIYEINLENTGHRIYLSTKILKKDFISTDQ